MLLQDARDILSALAGEAGFESFEDTENGVAGYVQQQLFDESGLQQLLEGFPLPQCAVSYQVSQADDRDWNEQWENEGFQPIVIQQKCVIHDGRHLPDADLLAAIQIEIDAKLAFGTGTHETTRMMVSALLGLPLAGRRILDCGTGTGILAIAALKGGASAAVGYDIDEWSVDNARHNAVINRVDERFQSLHGDASVLKGVEGLFDVVMANINRNILLADMPSFVEKMQPGGSLLLSGFYEDDAPMIVAKAAELGLSQVACQVDDRWTALVFRKA